MGGSPHITLCFFIRLQKFVLDLTKCFFTPLRSRDESFSAVSMEIVFFFLSSAFLGFVSFLSSAFLGFFPTAGKVCSGPGKHL